MLEYERRDCQIRFGKLVPKPLLPPARLREIDTLRRRYEEAVQRAAAHQTTFGHGHRWALQGEAPTTLSPPVSPTGSRASVRSRSLNSR